MRASSSLETVTRIGFAARGVMYGLIGYLALKSGRTEDGAGILDYLDSSGGRLLLGAMAAGFFAYGIWRLIDAWVDSEHHGSEAKGMAARIGGAVSGLIHLGLGTLALRLVLDSGGSGGGDSGQSGAATALSLPGGWLLLIAAAAALALTGVFQIVKAYRCDFLKTMDGAAKAHPWIRWLGRAGYAARGIVFLVMAVFFFQAGREGRSSEAGGLGQALDTLPSALQALVAAGLLLFGLFSFCEARFRRINVPAG